MNHDLKAFDILMDTGVSMEERKEQLSNLVLEAQQEVSAMVQRMVSEHEAGVRKLQKLAAPKRSHKKKVQVEQEEANNGN